LLNPFELQGHKYFKRKHSYFITEDFDKKKRTRSQLVCLRVRPDRAVTGASLVTPPDKALPDVIGSIACLPDKRKSFSSAEGSAIDRLLGRRVHSHFFGPPAKAVCDKLPSWDGIGRAPLP
jgi:hypothetical protein